MFTAMSGIGFGERTNIGNRWYATLTMPTCIQVMALRSHL